MNKKGGKTCMGGSGADGRPPVDYAQWQGIIERIGPGLLRYVRNHKLPATDHDVYDALIDAIQKITNKLDISQRKGNVDTEIKDAFVFTVARNALLNNIRSTRREIPLTFEIRVYSENDDIDDSADRARTEHSDSANAFDEPTDMKEAMKKVLLLLPKNKREFILDYVESKMPKTPAERSKAHRIRDEIETMMRHLGYDSGSIGPKSRIVGGDK